MILVNLTVLISQNNSDETLMQARETYSAVTYGVSGHSDFVGVACLTVLPDVDKCFFRLFYFSGTKGILNSISVHLDTTNYVYLKDYDIITSLEEI
jgi:hypothetical protein